MEQKTREACVSGKFYPAGTSEITEQLDAILQKEKKKIKYELASKRISGAILPHAAHFYSGYQAIHFFEILAKSKVQPETLVILHPVHQGTRFAFVTDSSSKWKCPMGTLEVDREMINLMNIDISEYDLKHEHSAEVFLPFIHRLPFKPAILPVGYGQPDPVASQKLANSLFTASNQCSRSISVIASCDFSHFMSPEKGYLMDQAILDRIIQRDPEGVYQKYRELHVTACGIGPVMSLMYYSSLVCPDYKPTVLARGHSGEVVPSMNVVDYISVLFHC